MPTRMDGIAGIPATLLLGFLFIYVRNFISVTTFFDLPDPIDRMLLFVGLFFLVLHIFGNGRLSVKRIVIYLGGFLVCAVVYLRAGETNAIVLWATAVAVSSAPNKEAVLRLWLVMTAALAVLLVVLYATYSLLAQNMLDVLYRNTEEGSTARYAFFLGHPNMAGTVVLSICGACSILYYDRLRFGHYVLALLLTGGVYVSTDSKTSSILLLALIVAVAFARETDIFRRKGVRVLCAVLPIVLLIATHLLATTFYSESIADWLTGRVSLWHSAAINRGITLFGQPLVTTTYVDSRGWTMYASTLDSLYADMLYVSGLVFGALLVVMYWRSFMHAGELSLRCMPYLFITIIYGVTEVQMLGTFTSCLALVLGMTALVPKESEAVAAPSEAQHVSLFNRLRMVPNDE